MRTKLLGVLALVLMVVNLWMVFMYAPYADRLQGPIYRIMFFHIPNAILSYLAPTLVFVGCVMFLIKRSLAWDRLAYCSAELGVVFTSTTLLTGMIWARPVWGTWWVWDARLTLELILLLTFVGYFMLRAYLPEREKQAKLSSIFGLLGMINVPINYMSIRWWRTQHPQPVILGEEGSGMDPEMSLVLSISFITFFVLFAYLLDRRLAVARVEDEVEYLEHAVHAS